MKKLLTIIACAAFIGTASAQTSVQTSAATISAEPAAATATIAAEPAAKEHVCSPACTKMAHTYLHGEKGHICTDACKTAATTGGKAACCAGKAQTAACCSGHGDKAHGAAASEHKH